MNDYQKGLNALGGSPFDRDVALAKPSPTPLASSRIAATAVPGAWRRWRGCNGELNRQCPVAC